MAKIKTEKEFLEKQMELCFQIPEITLEKNSGVRITKSAGYIPLRTQIKMMQDAGERLEMLREGLYDFQDDNDIHFEQDKTRALNYDLAEASEDKRRTDAEIKAIKRQQYLERIDRARKLMENETTKMVSIGDTINKDTSIAKPDTQGKEGKP